MVTFTAKVRRDNGRDNYFSHIVCIPKPIVKVLDIGVGDLIELRLSAITSKNGGFRKTEE
jgi:hypothetical protein